MKKLLSLPMAALLVLSISAALLAAPVDITAPPNGTTIKGDGVEIVIAMTPADQETISRVEVSLDGKVVTNRTYAPPVAGGNSVFKWDTTRTPNGAHTLDVSVFSGGNVIGSASCIVKVANNASQTAKPKVSKGVRVSIKSPSDGQVVSGTIPIIVESTDASGVDPFVSIYVDKSLRMAANTRPYRYDWNTAEVGNGPHYISANAVNDNDASVNTPSVRIIVRNGAIKPAMTVQSQGTIVRDAKPAAMASKLPSSSASTARTSAGIKVREAARSELNNGSKSESFELSQLPVQRSVSAKSSARTAVRLPAKPAATRVNSKPVQMASNSSKPASASTVAKTSAAPLPNGKASKLSQQVALAAAPVDAVQLRTSGASGGILISPSAPRVTRPLPSGKTSKVFQQVALAAAPVDAVQLPTSSASGSVLMSPSVPKSPAVVRHESASRPHNGSDFETVEGTPSAYLFTWNGTKWTVGVSSGSSSAVKAVKPSAALSAHAVPAAASKAKLLDAPNSAVAQVANKPVLLAKAEVDDMAVTSMSNSVLSSPSVPKPVARPKSASNVKVMFAAKAAKTSAAPLPRKKSVVAVKATTAKISLPAGSTQIAKAQPENSANCAVKKAPKAKAKTCKATKMARIRPAIDAAGGVIEWDNKAKTMHAAAKQKDIRITIGSAEAQVNSQPVKMDRAAALRHSRTVVPQTFIESTFGVSK